MSALLAGLILLAPPGAAAVDARAENMAVSRADSEMSAAVAARDARGFASHLVEDVVFVLEGAPLAVGRAAVVGAWAELFKEGGPTLTWRPTLSYVASSGDLAYTEGEFLSKARAAEGKEATRRGKSVTIWRKQLDGQWRAVVSLGNRSSGPAPGTAPRQAVIRAETSEAGDLHYALKAYETEAKDSTGLAVKRVGRYLTVRRKQPDGSWRTVVNADTTPGPTAGTQ